MQKYDKLEPEMQVTDDFFCPYEDEITFTLSSSFEHISVTNYGKTTFSHVCIYVKFGNFSFIKLFLLVKVSQYLFDLDKNWYKIASIWYETTCKISVYIIM